MNQSESIAELSAALAKAQGIMEGASKDSANPFFKSKYADLASVWDACRKPLSDNGLSVVQTTEFMPEHPDMVCIETILCHASGQWIKGRLAVKPVKSDPQSVGSCITYLRRYSLQSIVGIAPEDDDGNAASGKNEAKKQPEATTAPPEEVPPQANVESHDDGIEEAFVKIESVTSKEGTTNGKPWKAFFIKSATGGSYGTFSQTLADLANKHKEDGKLVRIAHKKGKKAGSRELVSIEDDAA
jgi:hypothetical protein